MIVNYVWPACSFAWDATRGVDAYWVLATEQEAESSVLPRLSAVDAKAARGLGEKYRQLAEECGTPGRSFTYLVAADLSATKPLRYHYPFPQLWNAYSPFRAIDEISIESLDELRTIAPTFIDARASGETQPAQKAPRNPSEDDPIAG